MLEDKDIILELSVELGIVSEKLNEAIKTLEWLNSFVQDKVVRDLTTATLKKIK